MVKDFLGQELAANDEIIYPVRKGSSMWLRRIKVTQVLDGHTPVIHGFASDGSSSRLIQLHNIQNVVKINALLPETE
jgi:hypothetical protein